MFIAYTDTVAPRFTVMALLAALEYRRRTGQGQYIDQSQLESALQFLSPALLDYTVNGRVQGRVGNGDAHMAPHGVYPAAGEDRWVAIAVATDAQWQALCTLMERPELCQDSRYATASGRLAHQDVLDALLATWTQDRDALAVEALLQTHGIAASVVQNMDELYHDPQLAQRGYFVRLAHPLLGTTTVEGSRFRLVDTPAQVNRAAPMLGCDTRYILETILSYAPDRIAALEAQGVFQ
jgi:crotonobetainyl-CoA:carnitine CoA-transferase CaiB-like acyl-CoA transferase